MKRKKKNTKKRIPTPTIRQRFNQLNNWIQANTKRAVQLASLFDLLLLVRAIKIIIFDLRAMNFQPSQLASLSFVMEFLVVMAAPFIILGVMFASWGIYYDHPKTAIYLAVIVPVLASLPAFFL